MKTNLPKQEYELINVCRQSIETGTALTCDDCGRTILNFATIKGKQDGKTYVVGLTCVKRLLNKTIYFDTATAWEYERQLALWNEAYNTRKWIDKQLKNNPGRYYPVIYNYSNGDFCVELRYVSDFGIYKQGSYAGHSKALSKEYKPLFADIA